MRTGHRQQAPMYSASWDLANRQQGKQRQEGKLLAPLAQPTGKVKARLWIPPKRLVCWHLRLAGRAGLGWNGSKRRLRPTCELGQSIRTWRLLADRKNSDESLTLNFRLGMVSNKAMIFLGFSEGAPPGMLHFNQPQK